MSQVEVRRAHIHRDQSAPGVAAHQKTAQRVDANPIAVEFLHQEARHAARSIPAGFHFAAIGIADAHRGVGPIASAFDHNDLIAADAQPPVGHGSGGGRVERKRLFSRVEDDEIVAQAVHFEEWCHDGPI